MPLSIRLGPELEHRLALASRKLKLNKTEVIKRSIEAYLDQIDPRQSPYELGKDLFGADMSEGAKVSREYKVLLKAALREKYHR